MVFLQSTNEVLRQLAICSDQLVWGYPSHRTISEIIHKRGFLKGKDNSKAAITDNVLIEQLMGSEGVLCLEDLIGVVQRPTAHFSAIMKKLWPFQLALKKEAVEGKIEHDAHQRMVARNQLKVSKGGLQGNLEDKINAFIEPLI